MKTYKRYEDPGHSWFAVKRLELAALGILHKITPYSYQKGATVYLEEDCDASTWFEAYRAVHGEDPQYISKYAEKSPVRGYESFSVEALPPLVLEPGQRFHVKGLVEGPQPFSFIEKRKSSLIVLGADGNKYRIGPRFISSIQLVGI